MQEFTKFDPRKLDNGASLEAKEQYLSAFMSAFDPGMDAVQAVVAGAPANASLLDDYAEALEALRVGLVFSGAFLVPTEDDVRNARHLAQLVREGAPSEVLIEPARRLVRMRTDGSDLERFQSALFCLEGAPSRVQHLERIQGVLDLTIALFERGCRAASFVSTPADVANVRRLREIAAAEGTQAEEERLRLVQELEARLPRSGSSVDRETAAESLYVER